MTTDAPDFDFVGAKVALICGDRVLTCLRDDTPGLPWRGMWDLPGGGREGGETPEACLLREVEEEFELRLPPDRLIWRRVWPSMMDASRESVFFAGRITVAEIVAIRFGDEGQRWEMMAAAAYMDHPLAIPEMQRRVRMALAEIGPV